MSPFDIEYELEKRFKKGLEAIFEKDDEFGYNSIDKETKVIITTDYPSPDTPFKTPHIVITGESHDINTQTTFGNNFFRDVKYNGMINGSRQFANVIPYSISLVCLGQWSLSKDLANRVAGYVSAAAYDYLSNTLNLHIQRVVKGATSPQSQYPKRFLKQLYLFKESFIGHL